MQQLRGRDTYTPANAPLVRSSVVLWLNMAVGQAKCPELKNPS